MYGLIGYPLGHSFSKRYFTEKFAKEGIPSAYLNFEIENLGELSHVISNHPTLQGFNVTIPHKQDIIPLLDEISDEARKIGAVNCVKITRQGGGNHLSGFNTDVYGFRCSLLSFIPATIHKALILGNGGAAKAVRYVLDSLGMEVLTVSRSPQAATEIGYPEVAGLLKDFKLIVNTTPLGTWPHPEGCPDIPYSQLTPDHYLFDLVYNPETTTFMQRGSITGAHTRNGLEMLRGQAEKAWKIWNELSRPKS